MVNDNSERLLRPEAPFPNDAARKSAESTSGETALVNAPVLRNFNLQTSMILRDSQTGQCIAATDPINGEVLRIEVTLTVVK